MPSTATSRSQIEGVLGLVLSECRARSYGLGKCCSGDHHLAPQQREKESWAERGFQYLDMANTVSCCRVLSNERCAVLSEAAGAIRQLFQAGHCAHHACQADVTGALSDSWGVHLGCTSILAAGAEVMWPAVVPSLQVQGLQACRNNSVS